MRWRDPASACATAATPATPPGRSPRPTPRPPIRAAPTTTRPATSPARAGSTRPMAGCSSAPIRDRGGGSIPPRPPGGSARHQISGSPGRGRGLLSHRPRRAVRLRRHRSKCLGDLESDGGGYNGDLAQNTYMRRSTAATSGVQGHPDPLRRDHRRAVGVLDDGADRVPAGPAQRRRCLAAGDGSTSPRSPTSASTMTSTPAAFSPFRPPGTPAP